MIGWLSLDLDEISAVDLDDEGDDDIVKKCCCCGRVRHETSVLGVILWLVEPSK